MIVRALDINHDWNMGKGKNDYLSGNAAIGQSIETRIMSFLGDCFFDNGAGVDWMNLLAPRNQLALQLALSAVILNTTGVTALLQLSTNTVPTTRKATVTFQVKTIYTKYSSSISLNANG